MWPFTTQLSSAVRTHDILTTVFINPALNNANVGLVIDISGMSVLLLLPAILTKCIRNWLHERELL